MTQQQIESLTQQEYCHLLSYGDAVCSNYAENAYDLAHTCQDDKDSQGLDWISTLDSTTYPSMQFGYFDVPYMSTVV